MYIEEKLDLVLKCLNDQQQLLELFIPDLRKKKYVANFLGISEQCLLNWIKDSNSPIEQGIHFRINSRGEIEFISESIIALKRNGGYKNRRENNKETMIDEVVPFNTKKILQKIGKISGREETPKGDVL